MVFYNNVLNGPVLGTIIYRVTAQEMDPTKGPQASNKGVPIVMCLQ